MDLVTREIADGNILSLILKFLRAGVMEDGKLSPTRKGTPQGGVISPLLANIVLNHLDWRLDELGYKFVRYADDFVVLCKTKRQADKAFQAVRQCIEEDLGLELAPDKTHVTTFGQGFNFLGFYLSAFTIPLWMLRRKSASKARCERLPYGNTIWTRLPSQNSIKSFEGPSTISPQVSQLALASLMYWTGGCGDVFAR